MSKILKLALLSCAAVGIASAAHAADLITTPAPMASDWDWYIGLQGGAGAALADHQPASPIGPGGNGYDLNLVGALLGVDIGGSTHINDKMTAGIQADIDWTNMSASNNFGGFAGTITQSINWIGTVEGRIGFDTGMITPYLAGGLAVAQGTRTSTGGSGNPVSATHLGLSVGAGATFQIADNVSADIEYRYQMFGAQPYNTGGTIPKVALDVGTIRAGINWHF